MEGRLLLDIVIREGAAILELLAGEDKTLLIRGDTLLVLDLLLHIVDGVRRLHLKGDSLTREGFDENLEKSGEERNLRLDCCNTERRALD